MSLLAGRNHWNYLILFAAHRKKALQDKTGGGPPPAFSPAEELALSNNQGRPLMEGVDGGGVTSDPSGGSSSQSTSFVQGMYQRIHVQLQSCTIGVMAQPPPNMHILHSGCRDTAHGAAAPTS